MGRSRGRVTYIVQNKKLLLLNKHKERNVCDRLWSNIPCMAFFSSMDGDFVILIISSLVFLWTQRDGGKLHWSRSVDFPRASLDLVMPYKALKISLPISLQNKIAFIGHFSHSEASRQTLTAFVDFRKPSRGNQNKTVHSGGFKSTGKGVPRSSLPC